MSPRLTLYRRCRLYFTWGDIKKGLEQKVLHFGSHSVLHQFSQNPYNTDVSTSYPSLIGKYSCQVSFSLSCLHFTCCRSFHLVSIYNNQNKIINKWRITHHVQICKIPKKAIYYWDSPYLYMSILSFHISLSIFPSTRLSTIHKNGCFYSFDHLVQRLATFNIKRGILAPPTEYWEK